MEIFRRFIGSLSLLLLLGSCKQDPPPTTVLDSQELESGVTIQSVTHQGNSWRIVTVDPTQSPPSIRLSDPTGKPLRHFSAFEKAAIESGETITWMMNAGMYHRGGLPVGLCISEGKELNPINQADGEGNFFLKPNGIFFLSNKGAQIVETSQWNPDIAPIVQCATQSGPLLVRQGKLHPVIRKNSPNTFIRNGVGIRNDGHLCFVISNNQVTFHAMALFLRDYLECPDALYLDGAVSALYAPKVGLTQEAKNLGPVFGLWK